MTIIPLKNSIQPSTKCCTTINGLWNTCSDYRNFGFWDKKTLNIKNIYFASENKFNIWDEQIKNIKKLEQSEYDSLTKNSIELLRMEYNLKIFIIVF